MIIENPRTPGNSLDPAENFPLEIGRLAADDSTVEKLGSAAAHSQIAPNYEVMRSLEEREEYLHLTDNLIREIIEHDIDTVVYLDKSGRPVSWLVHELWDQLAPPSRSDGTAYVEPKRKFVNIDREQWGPIVGRSEDGPININNIPQEQIDALRNVFGSRSSDGSPKGEQSVFHGKNVLIVDEVNNSGDTLTIARGIWKRAFPDAADIRSFTWMDGGVKRDKNGVPRSTKAPVWYRDDEIRGRLIGDRNVGRAERSENTTMRNGMYWLSTRFDTPDKAGLQLKREAHYLAQDLRDHRVLYRPASNWKADVEGIDDRIRRLNGITPDQYKNLRITTARAPQERIIRLGQLARENAA